VLIIALGLAVAADLDVSLLRDGDVILHKSRSAQSEALRAATHRDYTHVGLVFERVVAPASMLDHEGFRVVVSTDPGFPAGD